MLPLLLAAAPLLGKLLGGAAKGAADQRVTENNQALNQAQINNQNAIARAQLLNNNQTDRAGMQNSYNLNAANLDMARKQFTQNEPNAQARQAMVGSMLSRLQPLQMSGLSARVQQSMPKMNSIIDSLGPEARQAGSLLASRGLSGLQSGPTQFDALPQVSLPELVKLPPAQIAAMQKSGLLEKILGGIGLGGSIVGALGTLGGFKSKPSAEPSDQNGWG